MTVQDAIKKINKVSTPPLSTPHHIFPPESRVGSFSGCGGVGGVGSPSQKPARNAPMAVTAIATQNPVSLTFHLVVAHNLFMGDFTSGTVT